MSVLTRVLLLPPLAVTVWGQSTATMVGRVADPSGAVLSGAQVTSRNTATGLERSTRTTQTGDFELPLLP
ncbi:MAG: carboxypeptidase regulatory-like domain-containing protein, partial [Acidobacteria bacterium]|nr:carboxypeptidase regulatory-like domain-containing protein [Acidobacteriota bacterium]